jgi:hypothetical protein
MKMLLVAGLVLSSHTLIAESASDWGSYLNRPLDLRDLVPPDGRRFSLPHEFNYRDQDKRLWEAPTDLIVDGASIPMPFWSVIGGPFEGLYREASVVHDAGCCAQMQPWKDVHRMFYNAMRCSGVGWVKAKTMYWAVWAGGPRWTHLNTTMPALCKLAPPSGTPLGLRSWLKFRPEVAGGLWREINDRTLTLPEARAVARPFFSRSAMTDKDAIEFVSKFKGKTDLTPEERNVIMLSVLQSELFSDGEVKQVEQWVEKENPPLDTIESRADEARKRNVAELRLFPKIEGLRQSLQDWRGDPR